MKRLGLLLGIFLFLVMVNLASATVWECDSCGNCTSVIYNDAVANDTVKMIANISAGENDCVDFDYAEDNVTFDCDGFYITGDGGAIVGIAYHTTEGADVDFSTIKNCNIDGFGDGIVGDVETKLRIENTNISNAQYCIRSLATDGAIEISNFNCINHTTAGISIGTYSNEFLIEDFYIRNGQRGIWIRRTTSPDEGMNFSREIKDGIIYNESTAGIIIDDTLNVTMQNIDVSGSKVGIQFSGATSYYSENNTAEQSNIHGNTVGIRFNGYTRNNIITGNNIYNNDYGINVTNAGTRYSIQNSIYNNIINNTMNYINTNEANQINYWNVTKALVTNIVGGYYVGGNFWAYPNGTGYSETCTDDDSDGICDDGLSLGASNSDYLPLTYAGSPPVPPSGRPIDALGIFGNVALLVIGAGIIIFLLQIFMEGGEFLMRNLKYVVMGVIGTIIIIMVVIGGLL